MYRNTVNFYIFTLLNLLILCGIFFLNILGLFLNGQSCYMPINGVLLLYFQSFSCLIEWVRSSSIMMKYLSLLNILLGIGFYRCPLPDWGSYHLFSVFIMYRFFQKLSWYSLLFYFFEFHCFFFFLLLLLSLSLLYVSLLISGLIALLN